MLKEVHRCFQLPVLIVADSWFGNNGLWSHLDKGAGGCFNLLTRVRTNLTLYDFTPAFEVAEKRKAGRPRKYGKKREVLAYSQMVMLKTLKCPVGIVWFYRKIRYIALITTDLGLSIKQIIKYYGVRWKIESGFKEIKQEIGSSKSQTGNTDAVINHLNFCMMATTLTWIYCRQIANRT